MPKYYFLYKNELYSRQVIFQSDYVANTEEEVRTYFRDHYNAEMVAIRKGRGFSKSEIDKKQKEQRYA